MVVYFTICHHNFCFDVSPNKSSDSNVFGAIDTKKRDRDNKKIFRYGILSCFHHEHPISFPQNEDEYDTGNLPSITPA